MDTPSRSPLDLQAAKDAVLLHERWQKMNPPHTKIAATGWHRAIVALLVWLWAIPLAIVIGTDPESGLSGPSLHWLTTLPMAAVGTAVFALLLLVPRQPVSLSRLAVAFVYSPFLMIGCVLLNLLTCGLWAPYWAFRQMTVTIPRLRRPTPT